MLWLRHTHRLRLSDKSDTTQKESEITKKNKSVTTIKSTYIDVAHKPTSFIVCRFVKSRLICPQVWNRQFLKVHKISLILSHHTGEFVHFPGAESCQITSS